MASIAQKCVSSSKQSDWADPEKIENTFILCMFFKSKWVSMGNAVEDLIMNTSVFFYRFAVKLSVPCTSRFVWFWTGVSFLLLNWNIKPQFTNKFAIYNDFNITSDPYKHFQSSRQQLPAFFKVLGFQTQARIAIYSCYLKASGREKLKGILHSIFHITPKSSNENLYFMHILRTSITLRRI